MCITCTHVLNMSVMIQIRNVPDVLHRKLKARAALVGKPLSQYLLEEMKRVSESPTRDEILARIASRPKVKGAPASAASIIREVRER